MQVNLEPYEIPGMVDEVITEAFKKLIDIKEIWLFNDEMDSFTAYHYHRTNIRKTVYRGVKIKRILDGSNLALQNLK